MDTPSDQSTGVDSITSSSSVLVGHVGGKTSPLPSPSRSPSPSPRRRWSNNRGCPSPISTSGTLGIIRHHPHSPMTDPSSGPPLLLRVTKDPVQPATGSLSDIRRHATRGEGGPSPGATEEGDEDDDETADEFPEAVGRPRAFTCPVTKAFNRKRRARVLTRPPTPTYQRDGGATAAAASQPLSFDFQSLEINDVAMETGAERRPSNGPSEQLEAILETQ